MECEHHLNEIKDVHKVEIGKLSGEKIELGHQLKLWKEAYKKEIKRLLEEKVECESRLEQLLRS